MPGTNIIDTCSLFTESVFEQETLVIEASIEGSLTRDTEDFVTDTQTHYVETLSWEGSIGFGRISFEGRQYYRNSKRPEPTQFWFVQTCCCRCRWQMIFAHGDDFYNSPFTKADSSWTMSSTTGSNPPIETEGTYNAQAQYQAKWNNPVITTTGKTDRPPCRNANEGNLQGVNLAVTHTPNVLIPLTDMSDATETQTPTGIEDKQSGDSPHFILEADYGYVKCDGLNMSLKGKWVGHGETSYVGGTITEDLEVTLNISVKLE